ncbi:MAG: hypothetical protein ACLFN8_03255 [Candidatus Woesearchaeota archaeon]
MDDMLVMILGGTAILTILLFFAHYILNYKKNWQKLAKDLTLHYTNKKRINFSLELKKFESIKNDANTRLDLILEGEKNSFYWKVYNYFYIKSKHQEYKTIILLTSKKNTQPASF